MSSPPPLTVHRHSPAHLPRQQGISLPHASDLCPCLEKGMLPREALEHLNRSFTGFLTRPVSAESDLFPSHLCTWLCSLQFLEQRLQKKKNAKPKQCIDKLQEDSRQFRNGDSGGESLGREGSEARHPSLVPAAFPQCPS